ncbi:hypothetical protein [Ralstonia sp. UBA689]|uniref:hypothetical protein n=1 Tax=Ralstonia sp. UBA689 TaxID=1947373 RepID=UPI0025EE02FB|nr:hypothetical protein [Ralstonia sp. UBA689]
MIVQFIEGFFRANAARMAAATASGALWEIWLQVEFALAMQQNNISFAREVPYGDGTKRTVDFIVRPPQQEPFYAIEFKIESPTNAGKAIAARLLTDVEKLKNYAHGPLAGKFAIAVAYSAEGHKALTEAAAANKGQYAQISPAIGVALVPV